MKSKKSQGIQGEQLLNIAKRKGPYYIYIIQCNEYYKIGYSKNPIERLKNLQTGNPYTLELVRVYEIGGYRKTVVTERAIHRHYQDCKIKNEWYWDIDLDWFEGLLSEYLTEKVNYLP